MLMLPAPPCWLTMSRMRFSPLSSSNSATVEGREAAGAEVAARKIASRKNCGRRCITCIVLDAGRAGKFRLRTDRQNDREGRSLADFGFHFNPALVMLDDFLADGQTQA